MDLLAGDVAEDADGETGTREGMTADEGVGHPEFTAHTAHLVLEEPAKGLAELEFHLGRQAADVVVALDDLAGDVETLDAVGIDGALGQPTGIGDLGGLGIEDLDEVAAYDLALLLGIAHAGEVGEELLGGIYADDIEAETFVVAHDIPELVLAEHSVVHEDAGELMTDGAMEEHGGDAAVHASGETEDDAVGAYLLTQFSDGVLDERRGCPLTATAADAADEVLEEKGALEGVIDLGMELHGPYGLLARGGGDIIGGVLHGIGGGDDLCAMGEVGDGVAVAHPHLRVVVEAVEEGIVLADGDEVLTPVLTGACALHLAAACMGYILRSIADSEQGQTAAETGEVHLEGLGIIDGIGRAGENDADDVGVVLGILVVGQHLAEGAEFADTTGDELRGLRAEIENDYLLHNDA